ncbi:hypothetical protein OVA14_10800 [Agrococcus sp. SL85]|uniref:NAD(P)H-hydrate dehydratase n=1 Tax=Agrococcus sp. SL85 TaxID=2995141 RepID=UPI00226CDC0D|nr:NAD(P)H-hydrate dehydratase [Agrococcus sp. SL85]WAC65797.1 hypothetical protein OVA14_10800 [Agrococcus sp. SL85]
MLRELGRDADARSVRADPAASAAHVAEALGAVVLLKGATTLVVAPGAQALEVVAPTHRLAVAGSGDVLAGLLGAALAATRLAPGGHDALAALAVEGARLHGRAAALAAEGDVPIVALDVAARLADAQRA